MSTIICNTKSMVSDTMWDHGCMCSYKSKIFAYKCDQYKSLIGISGSYDSGIAFLKWYFSDRKTNINVDEAFVALELRDNGKIYNWNTSLIAYSIDKEFDAIGSGAAWAIGSLEAGASIQDALSISMKHDPYTGIASEYYTFQNNNEIYDRTLELLRDTMVYNSRNEQIEII